MATNMAPVMIEAAINGMHAILYPTLGFGQRIEERVGHQAILAEKGVPAEAAELLDLPS